MFLFNISNFLIKRLSVKESKCNCKIKKQHVLIILRQKRVQIGLIWVNTLFKIHNLKWFKTSLSDAHISIAFAFSNTSFCLETNIPITVTVELTHTIMDASENKMLSYIWLSSDYQEWRRDTKHFSRARDILNPL